MAEGADEALREKSDEGVPPEEPEPVEGMTVDE